MSKSVSMNCKQFYGQSDQRVGKGRKRINNENAFPLNRGHNTPVKRSIPADCCLTNQDMYVLEKGVPNTRKFFKSKQRWEPHLRWRERITFGLQIDMKIANVSPMPQKKTPRIDKYFKPKDQSISEVNATPKTPEKCENRPKILNQLKPKSINTQEIRKSVDNWPKTQLFSASYKPTETLEVIDCEPKVQSISNVNETIAAKGPKPLINFGNTCYLNAMIQSLFVTDFVTDLKKGFNLCQKESQRPLQMTKALLRIHRLCLQSASDEDVRQSLEHLKQCVGNKSFPFLGFSQQDSAEFFTHVIDTIDEELSAVGLSECNPIEKYFGFETLGQRVCVKCGNETDVEVERFHVLYLRFPEDGSLETAFNDFLKEETTGHKCVNSECDANENTLKRVWHKKPKVLFLQLGKYTRDALKRTEEVTVPKCLNFGVNENYRLVAVVSHHGSSLHVGHYTAFVLFQEEWYECDDTYIRAVDFEYVEKQSQTSGYCFLYQSCTDFH